MAKKFKKESTTRYSSRIHEYNPSEPIYTVQLHILKVGKCHESSTDNSTRVSSANLLIHQSTQHVG